jgi:glycosyltransferase involved in cell wall biosynthesis
LFLSRWFPYPPNNGSKLRVYNLLRSLASQHEVHLLSFVDQDAIGTDITEMESLCASVYTVPWRPFVSNRWQARLGYLSPTPRSVVDTRSKAVEEHISALLASGAAEMVIASQVDMAGYAHCFGGVPALFEEVELALMREQVTRAATTGQRLRARLTWAKHRRYMSQLLPHFQACTVVSHPERELLAEVSPTYQSVEVIPNCIDLPSYLKVVPADLGQTLIFTGSLTYFVNHEAVLWFLHHVFPLVQARLPETRLLITGDHAGKHLPPTNGLVLTGVVPDVRPLIAGAAASIVPIWQGGGTRLKILEAMALRTPVIATSKGAEGLEIQHGQHLLVADEPMAFAEAVISLLQQPAIGRRMAENAYLLVAEKYDWRAVMPRFLRLVDLCSQPISR